jgi:predicted NUDIX family NTP pyrophosphohydrolase
VPGRRSAGLLLHRLRDDAPEVLLVHPGGPLWARRDLGAWSIPKGELDPGEEPLEAARREFREETGFDPAGPFHPLPPVRQRGGKEILAWAVAGDLDPAAVRSGTFFLEWPLRSGRRIAFPEVDRAAWFGIEAARERILPGQAALLQALLRLLGAAGPPGDRTNG